MFLNLKPGDIIDVVAPSTGDTQVSSKDAEKFIKELGYIPRIPENLQTKNSDPFASNPDQVRYEHLRDACMAEDSNLVWMFRGGYGATRLLSLLDKHDFPGKKKTIIGFSDIIALGLYFVKKYDSKKIVIFQIFPVNVLYYSI